MNKFIHSIANQYERFVFSSTNLKDPADGSDLVQIICYSVKGSRKSVKSYLPIDHARDYYRRLMTCNMNFQVVTLSN